VLNQNYPNLEYIIVDGGSTDETVSIIKKYENHLSWWVSEPDNGQTDAINKGFLKCTGEIFNWLNSDDYYEPGAFHELAQLFAGNLSKNVVCGTEWSFDDTAPLEKTLNKGSVIKDDLVDTIRIGIMDQPCTFFRKTSIDDFFPLCVDLHYVMDRQLWWKYLLKYGQDGILKTGTVFTNFRLHPNSKSVGFATLFEAEFDMLKFALFKQLGAPAILEEQLLTNRHSLNFQWQVEASNPKLILAAFASYYAERNYIIEDIEATGGLMKLVATWKGFKLSKKEWKIWIASNLLPRKVTRLIKRFRK
jgi:glycosyltransferase involved in cell wall biosynthesis